MKQQTHRNLVMRQIRGNVSQESNLQNHHPRTHLVPTHLVPTNLLQTERPGPHRLKSHDPASLLAPLGSVELYKETVNTLGHSSDLSVLSLSDKNTSMRSGRKQPSNYYRTLMILLDDGAWGNETSELSIQHCLYIVDVQSLLPAKSFLHEFANKKSVSSF